MATPETPAINDNEWALLKKILLNTGLIVSNGGGGGGGGSGTVTNVSVSTANGVSGSVANATTTPAISLTLGDITPSSVNNAGASTIGSTQNVKVTEDSSTAITAGAHFFVSLNNASPVAVTLPLLAGLTGRTYHFKNLGAGMVTISSSGADNIFAFSSVTSFSLATGEAATVIAGTVWQVE